jgi:hypothetical protein
MEKRNCAIALLASLILLFTGMATGSTVINYQGILTDSSGDPVPDSTYQIIFSIWDDSTGGTQVWISALTSVETTEGRFSVALGATEPLDRDMLGSGPVYLEIQVETEPPMDPRIQLNWVPYGAVAQRVLGDVQTGEGSLTVQLENAEQTPYINLNVDSAQANVMLSPGYPDGPAVNMLITETLEGMGAELTLRGENGDPNVGMHTGDEHSYFNVTYTMPLAVDKRIVEVLADSANASLSIKRELPDAEPPFTLFEASANDFLTQLNLQSLDLLDGPSANMTVTLTTEAYDAGMTFIGAEGGPTLKAGADPDAAGIEIVNGLTSGDSAIIQLSANNGADLTMYFAEPLDNQAHGVGLAANSGLADVNVYFAEPLDERSHGVQIFSDSSGGNINIYREQGGGDEIGTTPNSGVSARIFNPQPEPPGGNPMIEMSTAPGNNASIVMFQPQPEPPGNLHEAIMMTTTPESRAPSASIKMFQPQPEPPGIPAAVQMTAETNNTFFDVFKYTQDVTGGMDSTGMHMMADSSEVSMELLQGANTWVRMFANDSSGGVEFFDEGSKYMGVEPSPFYNAGDLKMYDSALATSIIVSSAGQVSIGTGVMGNILTILRNSPTDPIADAWTLYSSRRWKRNIEPIEGSLDKVMNLRGVSFNWKENGKEDIGLIAEEVAEVIPEVVAFEENGEDAQSVDYSRLVALLIEATKEQQTEIEELKAEIGDLKDKIK